MSQTKSGPRSCVGSSCLFIVGLLTAVTPSFSAEITVDSLGDDRLVDGNCELAEAIDAATTNSAVDGCVAGELEGTDVVRVAVSGIVALKAKILSQSSVQIVGLGREGTIIDCRNVDESCITTTFETTSLERLTVLAEDAPPLEVLPFTSAMLTNVDLQGGLAIHVWPQGNLALDRSLVAGFDTNAEAGSITTTGGALFNEGDLVLRDSSFVGNRARSVGDNRADSLCCRLGGGVREAFGGAIYSSGGSVVIERATFSGNSAEAAIAYGGALAFSNTVVTIEHSTLAGNWVDSSGTDSRSGAEPTFGGGIYLGAASSLVIQNSIVGGNTAFRPTSMQVASELYVDPAAAVGSAGHNFVRDNRDSSGAFPAGQPNGLGDYVGQQPAPLPLDLEPLGEYGGDLPTFLPTLVVSSLIIDRGSCSLEAVDQRGFGSSQTELRATNSVAHPDDHDGCDIGAVEALAIDRTAIFSDGFESGNTAAWSLSTEALWRGMK